MPVLAVVLVALTVVSGTCAIVGVIWRVRTPPELRGDWWLAFEREFRAYCALRRIDPGPR